MAARKRRKPRCIIIAGPNGAGKTRFAKKYLPNIAGLVHFINADLIAGGIRSRSLTFDWRRRGLRSAALPREFDRAATTSQLQT
jgi:predicted AAA+ superfamily ATPase